jgi:FkbM family methyltransferase
MAVTSSVLRALARYAWFVEDEILGLPDFVRPGDVCLDIGAEYGLYTLALAACCGPEGRVHGIEPQPDAFRVLRTGVNLFGDHRTIRLHRHALADRPQRGWMSVPRRRGLPVHGRAFLTDGATEPGPNAIEFRVARWLPVEVTTLDAFCAQQGIARLNFIKADVEGAEIKVLRGGMDTLTRHRPVLQLEIEEPHIAKYGASAADIVDLLGGLGYTMHAWRDGAWQPIGRVIEHRRNYLFVP